MPGPFYNAIKGTTAGTPGTGAFTPNAASTGFRAWSTVPTGWIGLVRFEDGTAWELSWCYWNGTTLSRGANQRFDSSTGSLLSLTSSATASMIIDAGETMSHLGGVPVRGAFAAPGGAALISWSLTGGLAQSGTQAAGALATTNYLTEQVRSQSTSATTANAQATNGQAQLMALGSATAGRGGWEFAARFGASQLPTGPRAFIGMSGATFVGNTGEPSAFTQHYAVLGKDSTDTNFQFLVNSNAGSGTKIDTGIPWAANGWYEPAMWQEPGSLTTHLLLIRLDTGDIFYTNTATDVPSGFLMPMVCGGLNGTNTGTAIIMNFGSWFVRASF